MASIRQLPSGNYQVQVRLQGLRPIYKSFTTRRKAEVFARQVEGNAELARKLGKPVQGQLTFKMLCDLYMKQYSGRDRGTAGKLFYWCHRFGDMPVVEIDEFHVDDGLIELAKTRTGSTVNRYKSTLSAVFIFFIQHPEYKRLQFSNPVRKESVSRFKENPAKDRFLSQEEQQSLLAAARDSHWDKLYLLVLIALSTGARRGELLGLRWVDINFTNRAASLATTKNGKPRLLPLTRPVIAELMRFRENTDTLIFRSTISKNTSFETRKAWQKALAMSGIGYCRFHDLRHTAASNLVQAGRTLFEVGTLLGHSSTAMTARYAHLAIADTLDMVDTVMGGLK